MEVFWKFQEELIKEYPGFIYEMEIYKKDQTSWNLEESSMYQSNKFIKDIIPFCIYKYEGYELHKFTSLIAAPSSWLKQNAFKIEIENGKEKRKRIKDEKSKIKTNKVK